jgi:HK97 family phage major capsid protein
MDARQAQELMAKASSLRTAIELKKFDGELTTWSGSAADGMGAAGHTAALRSGGMKSIGEQFTDSAEFKNFARQGGNTMALPWQTEEFDIASKHSGFGGVEYKDVYAALGSHPVNLGVGTVAQFDPMLPRLKRTARVRDLFPVARTSANLIDYFRVVGFNENNLKGNAQMVPERSGGAYGLKPQSTLQFTSDQAVVRTIAHWEAIHRNVVDDVPQLQAVVNNELLYGLALKEDDQILNGDGTGENLRGVLNTPGLQLFPKPGSTEWRSDSLRKAITLTTLAYYPATGIILHPNDWQGLEITRGSTNDHYAITTNIAIGATPQAWRLPVVETPTIVEGNFLVGAFGTAAQLYDRQQANIRVAEQHADFFLRNAVVVLCEERLALAVKRPEGFVYGQFNG